MIHINQVDNTYVVKFPYDAALVSAIKSVPGRSYHSETRAWTIPRNNLGIFIAQIKGTSYESDLIIQSSEDIGQNYDMLPTSIPEVDVSNLPMYVESGSNVYPHQVDFMKYAVSRQIQGNTNGFILGDEQGCGKTLETINLALYNKQALNFNHTLIICCVNTAKYHWAADIEKHTNGEYSGYILGSRKNKKGHIRTDTGNSERLEDLNKLISNSESLPYFLILNIEAIRYKQGKKYPIADAIIELANSGTLNLIAIDEVHKGTSCQSKQGKQILRIKNRTENRLMWIPITGTPIVSKPTDVFLPLYLVGGHAYKSYYTWCLHFCIYGGFGGHEIIAYKNTKEIQTMLSCNMIRRLKSEVLNLPPKIYYTEYVDNTSYQNKMYSDVLSGILQNKEAITSSLNPLSLLLKLRQVNGCPEVLDPEFFNQSNYIQKNAKLVRVLELIEDIHSRQEKVVIFSNWLQPLRTLYKLLQSKYNVCCYTGTMDNDIREKHKEVFIHNPKYTIMLGTIGALGTMHTLTVANNVIFLDEPWTATDKMQAEDRCHRISTSKPVNIYTIITRNTIDDRVHDILYKKRSISQIIVDNIDIHSHPELLDILLQ